MNNPTLPTITDKITLNHDCFYYRDSYHPMICDEVVMMLIGRNDLPSAITIEASTEPLLESLKVEWKMEEGLLLLTISNEDFDLTFSLEAYLKLKGFIDEENPRPFYIVITLPL